MVTAEELIEVLPPNIATRLVVDSPDRCWEMRGWHTHDGYPYAYSDGASRGVHRIVMQLLGHEISGLDVDHLCRNRGCVNPAHLEPVTHTENMARTRITRCLKAGHDWSDPGNFYVRPDGRRTCAECHRIRLRAKRAARSAS